MRLHKHLWCNRVFEKAFFVNISEFIYAKVDSVSNQRNQWSLEEQFHKNILCFTDNNLLKK